MTSDDTLDSIEWRSLRTRLSHDLVGNCLLNELDAIEIRPELGNMWNAAGGLANGLFCGLDECMCDGGQAPCRGST